MATSTSPMTIYGDLISGNCLKVKYTADKLGLPYEWRNIDVLKDETRTLSFLAMNPMGQVPTILLADGRALAQSNAIIRYLASGSSLLPADAYQAAKVDELLFWEQYSHEPYVAVCRFQMAYLNKPKDQRDAWRVKQGEAALDFMEDLLTGKKWFAGQSMTIADICLFGYTRLADEGGFDLSSRPNILDWIKHCEDELGLPHRQMTTS
jgi:glutathione S-transferase